KDRLDAARRNVADLPPTNARHDDVVDGRSIEAESGRRPAILATPQVVGQHIGHGEVIVRHKAAGTLGTADRSDMIFSIVIRGEGLATPLLAVKPPGDPSRRPVRPGPLFDNPCPASQRPGLLHDTSYALRRPCRIATARFDASTRL